MTKRTAFTLLEVMISLVIIGLIAGLTLPNLMRRQPESQWPKVLEELNTILYFARQQAISNQKNYRILFAAPRGERHAISVEVEQEDPEKPGEMIFVPAHSDYVQATYTLPESIQLQSLWQGRVDQFEENKGTAYAHVIPNGLVQEALVHAVRTEDGATSKVSFSIQPFFGRFEMEQDHKRPGR